MIRRFLLSKGLYSMTFSLLISGFIASCGGNGRSVSEEDTAQGIPFDSIMKETVDAENVMDSVEKKPTRIRSKEEIISYIQNSPDRDKYEEGIIPTIAQYVPEYASKLLDNTHNGFLIVDKNTMKLYRYDKYGRELENVGIALSKFYGTKHKKADNRTPEGFFEIEGIYNSTNWLFTNDAGYTSPARGSFGPRFMRLKTPVTSQVGIHGTSAPGSIGGRRSHGCIRMTNDNIMRIHKLCEAGMPVIVSPGPRDMEVNESEGYHIPSVPVTRGGVPCSPGRISEYESTHVSEASKKTEKVNPVTPANSNSSLPNVNQPVEDPGKSEESTPEIEPAKEESQPSSSEKTVPAESSAPAAPETPAE